jgi:prophage maintenance system killer protein
MTSPDNWTDVIGLDEIMGTHAREMARHGAKQEPGRPDCIEAALGTAWLSEQYATSELDVAIPGFVFACYALRGLAMNHCLPDGNKRLAWIAFTQTLASIQLAVDADPMDAAAFVNSIVVDHLGPNDVIRWVSERLIVLGATA